MNIRKTINFLRLRKFFYVVAVALMLASVASLAVKQLNLGLDFTGGALVELNYSEAADLEAIRATLRENGWGDAVVQNFGASTDVLIRLPSDDPNLGNQVAQMIKTTDGNDVSVKRVEFIGPQVGEELRDQGGLGMLVAIAGILLYVSLRFQMKFAVAAILALVHDVIFTLGVFSFFGISFDLTVLAAILAVIGYSLNDTIVILDRIRENRGKRALPSRAVVNQSINQAFSRTILTSVTTVIAVLINYVAGGTGIRAIVIGGKVVAAMTRTGAKGGFRSFMKTAKTELQ